MQCQVGAGAKIEKVMLYCSVRTEITRLIRAQSGCRCLAKTASLFSSKGGATKAAQNRLRSQGGTAAQADGQNREWHPWKREAISNPQTRHPSCGLTNSRSRAVCAYPYLSTIVLPPFGGTSLMFSSRSTFPMRSITLLREVQLHLPALAP